MDRRMHKLLIKPYANYDCLGEGSIKQTWGLFHQQIGCKFREGASELLHLEYDFDTETWTLKEVD
jgi:hypothetical protein